MEIRIDEEKVVTLKRSLRSLMMYENITGEAFGISNTTQVLTYMYCCVLCSDKDLEMSFEKFIDILDENPKYLEDFQKWLIESEENTKALSKKKSKKETVKETH